MGGSIFWYTVLHLPTQKALLTRICKCSLVDSHAKMQRPIHSVKLQPVKKMLFTVTAPKPNGQRLIIPTSDRSDAFTMHVLLTSNSKMAVIWDDRSPTLYTHLVDPRSALRSFGKDLTYRNLSQLMQQISLIRLIENRVFPKHLNTFFNSSNLNRNLQLSSFYTTRINFNLSKKSTHYASLNRSFAQQPIAS
jgi:hypothetical protein